MLGVASSGREVLLLAAAEGSDKLRREHICKTDGSTGALLNSSGNARQSYTIQKRVRGLSSGHEIQTKPIRKVNIICGRRSF